MKLLFESIGAGILVSSTIYMGVAIFYAILVAINHFGGTPYIFGFIFLIAVGMFSTIFYYQNKDKE